MHHQLLKKAGELGLLGSGVPEEYGGSDLDKISGTLLSEKSPPTLRSASAWARTPAISRSAVVAWHRATEKYLCFPQANGLPACQVGIPQYGKTGSSTAFATTCKLQDEFAGSQIPRRRRKRLRDSFASRRLF